MYFLPIDLLRRPGWTFVATLVGAILLLTFCGASMALAAETEEAPHVAVRLPNGWPRTPAQARHLLAKLRSAAFEVCGGSDVSLPQYKAAVTHSRCYRDALARAVQQADSPMLAQAYDRSVKRNRAS